MQSFITHPGAAAQLHRLRLAQELQLDALRLAFTAASRDTARPWRSWMAADLDRALALATVIADLTTELGPGGVACNGPDDGHRLGAGRARQVVRAASEALTRQVAELEGAPRRTDAPVQAGRASGAGASGAR